ncbi:MAG: SUMF1/EgtB/PvdO family nonheme iron enzyme [Bryobacteraceae bacterium]
MARIFISYRWSQTTTQAELLAEKLEEHYPGEVFLDRKKITGGKKWRREILQSLADCEVLLVVMGRRWLAARDRESGKRRLDIPDDWVRLECETQLAKASGHVIPVLVDKAKRLGPKARLPKKLMGLIEHEPVTIGERQEDCLRKLVHAVEELIGPGRTTPHKVKPEDPTAYLQQLHKSVEKIKLPGFEGKNVWEPRLLEIYTELSVHDGGEREAKHGLGRDTIPLQNLLAKHRTIGLDGLPGSGKSTFVQRIVLAACDTLTGKDKDAWKKWVGEDQCPMPIRVRAFSLASFIAEAKKKPERQCPADSDSPQWLIHHLGKLAEEDRWQVSEQFFVQQLEAGALVLVDGLDEPSSDLERKQIASLIHRAARTYEQSRFVTTSRPSAWGGMEIPGFAPARIAEFDDKQITAFVTNWSRALHADDGEKAKAHAADLMSALRGSTEVAKMARTPVMLTALAVLHRNQSRLPHQRVKLYEAVLKWLALSREEKKGRVSPELRVRLLQRLAFRMQTDKNGRLKGISPDQAAEAIKDLFRGPDYQSDQDRKLAAETFLKDEETESGIMRPADRKLEFWHLMFQDYLAANTLRSDEREAEARLFGRSAQLYSVEWRETVPLYAGLLCESGSIDRLDRFLQRILAGLTGKSAKFETVAKGVGLMGRLLRDLAGWDYHLPADLEKKYRALLKRAEEVFEPKGARALDLQTREDVADAIGQAGDPRLKDEESRWIWVEGGEFWMGAQTDDPKKPNHDKEAWGDEAPVKRENVDSFWMAQYPVTVQEYAGFVNGHPEREPDDWPTQRAYPNRPVVLVSWHDAIAYCEWRNQKDPRYRIGLPTEKQWEYAARHGRTKPKEKYPWGSEKPDGQRANFREVPKAPLHPTPVGMFPEGSTTGKVDGIHDLAGNVWEWTDSDRERDDPSTKSIRGGSWDSNARILRVSCRDWNLPEVRSVLTGFRLIREQLSL